jgi:diacylglycerol kinase family enzyme
MIVNPYSRRVTPAATRAVTRILGAGRSLRVVSTESPSGGIAAARDAVESGAELVVAFGGDGLVNEVVNGLVGSNVPLGVIPGGTMNVFARSLGLPRVPGEAARHLAARAGDGIRTAMDLGCANDRWFTFACGMGFDAEAATRVNGHPRAKHRYGEPYFYAAALATLVGSYAVKAPFLRCTGDFRARRGVLAIALVGRPYAYLAGRPIRLGRGTGRSPRRAAAGLSLFVLRDMRLRRVPEYALAALFTGRFGPGTDFVEGLRSLRVDADEPIPAHVDGERLPFARSVEVRFVRAALTVVA